jgi:hypothetical protein
MSFACHMIISPHVIYRTLIHFLKMSNCILKMILIAMVSFKANVIDFHLSHFLYDCFNVEKVFSKLKDIDKD